MWTSDSFKQMNMKLFQAHSVAPLTNGQGNLEVSCNSSRCNPQPTVQLWATEEMRSEEIDCQALLFVFDWVSPEATEHVFWIEDDTTDVWNWMKQIHYTEIFVAWSVNLWLLDLLALLLTD